MVPLDISEGGGAPLPNLPPKAGCADEARARTATCAAHSDKVQSLEAAPLFLELPALAEDEEVQRLGAACCRLQRLAALARITAYAASPETRMAVSEEALRRALETGEVRSDIRTVPGLSNCLFFHTGGFETSILEGDILEARTELDQLVGKRLRGLLGLDERQVVEVSGHFLYPPGGFMGWHTNERAPGWRVYLSHAEKPGRSFFRYMDPESGRMVTSWDRGWDARMFRIDAARPFWHTVHSETFRYSLGYRIRAGG